MSQNPVVSIITVVFNAKKELEKTIPNVIEQTYDNVEYIVVDGGSTDGTLDIIKGYENHIDYWVSEADNGIYDAMNKGLTLCNGALAIMMNAGDLFYSKESIENAIMAADNFNEPFFGIAKVTSPFTSFLKPSTDIKIENWLKGNLPIHQAVFIPRSYMNIKYNTKFKVSGDSDYLYRVFNKSQPQFIPVKIAKFFLGGVSSKYKNSDQFKNHLSERLRIIDKYQNRKTLRKFYTCFAFSIKYLIGMLFNDEIYYKLVRNGVKIKKIFG